MTYQDVIEEYKKAKARICLSDECLDTPRVDLPIVGEYAYGVVWVRDDAVELLIKRIENLEKTNFLHRKLRCYNDKHRKNY